MNSHAEWCRLNGRYCYNCCCCRYNMYMNHLNTTAKKSLCKVTQRWKYPGFPLPFFLFISTKALENSHLSREKSKWSKHPLWEHKGYIYFLVTINFDYKDFFLCWIRCVTWDQKYGTEQVKKEKEKNNNLIGPVAFPYQWEGYIISKRTISGKESACQYKETQDMGAQFLGQKDPLEKEMATHSSILAWKIPWTEEPRGL